MSYYTDLVTLKNYMPSEKLQQLTDDNNTDRIDVEKVNYAIKQASDFIDMHLQGRCAIPLNPVTDSVRDMCTKLTVYYLYRRGLAETLPESIKIDYKEVTDHLRQIQRGEINMMPEVQNPMFFASGSDTGIAVLDEVTNDWKGYVI